ncbi:MAG TPA: hypothetical protein VFE48_25550 [Methylomirabilota bacterium]|nr:hypothetical protein [Methylomirabilota bacterium]
MTLPRVRAILEAVRPIAHGDTLTGIDNATNTRLFMRTGMLLDGKPARVPDLSENALRAVMVRRPLHDHLLTTLGLGAASIPQSVLNLLFSGGNMASGAKAPSDEVGLGHAVRRVYPSLALLGGAVDGFVLPRSRLRLSAWPVAAEYAWALAHVAPDLVEAARTVSIFDLLAEETRTRGTGAESSGNQMLYTYETLAAGTRVVVEFTLDAHTPPEVTGALAVALEQWDGFLGGQGRQGRGRMVFAERPALDPGPYLDHLAGHADALREGLVTGRLGTERVLCAP